MSSVVFTNTDNSSGLANALFTSLTAGVQFPAVPDFTDPKFSINPDTNSDLYKEIAGATLKELTENDIDGNGVFDVLMSSVDKHLQREYKGNRITGAQYAEVYVSVANQVLAQAANFVLQKDQARWAAVTAQMQARIAEIQATQALIELEKAKFETTKTMFEMNLTGAQYALTKMQIATEEANHDSVTADVAIKQYQRNFMLPAERAVKEYERMAVMPSTVAMNQIQVNRVLPAQASISEFQNRVIQPLEAAIQEFKLDQMMPVELDIIKEQYESQRSNTLDTRSDGLTPISGVVGLQKRNLTVDAATKDYVLSNQLPRQVQLISEQVKLTVEQMESERSKTLDTRTDGATVEGSVGKQKDLYDQQIDSFIKDAAYKAAKMYFDGWVAQKTMDEGLSAPTQLTNNEINSVLQKVRQNNNL